MSQASSLAGATGPGPRLDGAAPESGGAGERARLLGVVRDHRSLAIALLILLAMAVIAVLAPPIWSMHPNQMKLSEALQAPSAAHPMGTDDLGRDVLSRVVAGARLSLAIGVLVVLVGASVGGTLGVVAGLASRRLNEVFALIINALLAFPPLMLAIAVAIALGSGVWSSATGLVVAAIPWYARVIRSEVIRLRATPLMESMVALGASPRRIVGRHLIPHLLPTLVIQMASSFGWAILFMASLGFVGLGAQPPTAEWGAMITKSLEFTLTGQWWVGVFPGLALVIAVWSATVVADGLRDLLDPKLSAGRS